MLLNQKFIAGGLFGIGLAVLGGYALSQSATPAQAQVEDGPGPNLVIEVAGESNGQIIIDLLPDLAPKHVAQIIELAAEGAYDGVVFHRVIDGFMAQTGDVEFGKDGADMSRAGMGGSSRPDLPAEFSDVVFERGIVGMARAASPDSANSQIFIMFGRAENLDGQYTVVGRVISGLDVLDGIKRGQGQSGSVAGPADKMVSVTVAE
jgi:peptidylprolyl isomerase